MNYEWMFKWMRMQVNFKNKNRKVWNKLLQWMNNYLINYQCLAILCFRLSENWMNYGWIFKWMDLQYSVSESWMNYWWIFKWIELTIFCCESWISRRTGVPPCGGPPHVVVRSSQVTSGLVILRRQARILLEEKNG